MNNVNPGTLEKLKLIPEKEWGAIFKKITLYGELRLTKIGFKPRTENDIKTPEDFATEAITKIFDGTREWDFVRFPDILIHLKGVVKSLISSHLKTSSKSIVKKETFAVANIAENIDACEDLVSFDNPEEIIISNEKWQEVEAEFGDDADGFIICCEWFDGVAPREIAKQYYIDVTTVYKKIRKGKAIITKIFTC